MAAPPLLFEEWMALLEKVFSYNFENQEDIVLWKWCSKKTFTTKSVYDHLSEEGNTNTFSHIWKTRIPYKIKIFTWLLEKGVVLTKDNMVKRKWTGDPSCVFCDQVETINHLFFQCPVAKCVWALVGQCIGATDIPRNNTQYKLWIDNGYQMDKKFTTSGLQRYAGPFGSVATKRCLMLSVYDTLQKSYYIHVIL